MRCAFPVLQVRRLRFNVFTDGKPKTSNPWLPHSNPDNFARCSVRLIHHSSLMLLASQTCLDHILSASLPSPLAIGFLRITHVMYLLRWGEIRKRKGRGRRHRWTSVSPQASCSAWTPAWRRWHLDEGPLVSLQCCWPSSDEIPQSGVQTTSDVQRTGFNLFLCFHILRALEHLCHCSAIFLLVAVANTRRSSVMEEGFFAHNGRGFIPWPSGSTVWGLWQSRTSFF